MYPERRYGVLRVRVTEGHDLYDFLFRHLHGVIYLTSFPLQIEPGEVRVSGQGFYVM